jgi:hypothetical protein
MYVVQPAEGAPPVLVWATKDGVYSAVLEAVPDEPAATPAPSGSGAAGSAAPSGAGSSGSPKP